MITGRFRQLITIAIVLAAIAAFAWWRSGSGGPGGEGGPGDGKGPKDTLVTLATVEERTFVDLLEAVGTARANESADLTAKTSETVAAIHFTDGQKVSEGFAVAELTQREQSADLSAAQAALKEAERTLVRVRDLSTRGFATRAQLDQAQAANDAAAARVNATRSRITDRTIRAPFAGVLGLRKVSVGSLVRPGDIITTIDDISRIKVDFTIPEVQLGAVRKGLEVRARVAAWPDRQFRGKVESIDTRVDPVSRAVAVRAILPNPDGTLLPGMLATIGIESNGRKSLAVPEEALVPLETKQYVFVVPASMEAERREVRIGAREPGFVEIISGLKPGEQVVVEGTLRLRPGGKVKVAGTEGSGDDPRRNQAGQDRRP